MIVDSLNEYIDALAGHLYDNDKVVTYKWLSKELEVHVNVAKQILWEFVQRHKKEEDIVCTYLLMGTLKDGGIHVEVVKDEKLNSAKEKFSNIISEHIYSLQKTLPDIELLAISGDGDVKFSAIKSTECTLRSDDEMHVLRWGTTMSSEIAKPIAQKPKPAEEKEKSNKPEAEQISTIHKPATKNQKGFNSLFGKAKTKPNAAPKHPSPPTTATGVKKESPKEKKQISPKKKAHQNDMKSFWGASKPQESTSKASPPESKVIQVDSDFEEEKKVQKTTSDTKRTTKAEPRGKKRNRSKESGSVKPKRKRIILDSESSDSEVELVEDEVEEIPPSPEKVAPKARSPSPPKVKLEGGKRKVLKLVDKTFEEDGYLVTRKVHEYQSCSEEEPEEVPVKKASPENRSEPKGKKITKQTTLMNFFKKS